VSQIYTIMFAISVLLLIILMFKFYGKVSSFYVLLFFAVAVENLGYMQLASAVDIRSALYANQVVYVGGCVIPFFQVMCIADLCKARVSNLVQCAYLTLAATLFTCASSVGITNWYYESVELIRENGFSYLAKVNGPAHNLHTFYLASAVIYGLYIIIKSFQNRKNVSYRTSTVLILVMTNVIALYVIQKALNLHIELLPFAYVANELILLFLLRRVSLYDVTAISIDSMVKSMDYGFVVFDSRGRFLGSDEAAKFWFEELYSLPIDRLVPTNDSELFRQIHMWIDGSETRNSVYITNINKLIIEAKHTIIKASKSNAIHCIYLRDETKHQQYDKLIKKYNDELTKDVEAKTDQLKQVQEDIIISMASIVENRDNNTGGHIKRTSDIVKIFVKELRRKAVCIELTSSMAEYITKAAPLHDFGKIAIPDDILNKKGKFEPWEYDIMKEHSAKGAVIVERILQNSQDAEFKKVAVNVAHYHHEKWDGKGYPEGLSKTDIPFEARVMALADVFDALVSKRVYKEKFSYDKAFAIIEESCGTHFDPKLCKEFLAIRDKLERLYDSYPADEEAE